MGVLKCSVNSCGRKNSEKDIAFFFFPSLKLTQRHNAWIRACHRDKGWKPSKNSVVCENHFDLMDYLSCTDDKKKKKRLKRDVVPHLNLDPTARVFHDDLLPSRSTTTIKPSKHWLNKMGSFKTCFICNKKTDWFCGAPMCMKSYCLSPCFTKHQEMLANYTDDPDCEGTVQDKTEISDADLLSKYIVANFELYLVI